MKYLLLPLLSICALGFRNERGPARAGKSCYVSGRDTLDFSGTNTFRIHAHSHGRDRELTGTYAVFDRLMELRFDGTESGSDQRAFYAFERRKWRYVSEVSTGVYGCKGQRFRLVLERPEKRK